MPGPLFVFSFVVATLIGALFHLIVGGDARRLALFLLAGWIGFVLGHTAGRSLAFDLYAVGQLRLIPAIIGAILSLIAVLIFTSGQRHSR